MPRLFALSGVDLGRSFEVRAGAAIGRGADCEVVLRDASISRKHAHVAEVGGVWSVIDDASRNGLWSGGKRVPSIELADLAEFRLGDVSMRFRTTTDAPTGAEEALEIELGSPKRAKPPTVAPTPVEARPAPERLELDEIVLEEDPAPIARSAPPPAPRPLAPSEPTSISPRVAAAPPKASEVFKAGLAASARPASKLENQGARVLQFQKIENRSGFLSSDLEQRPAWVRWLVFAIALAVCAAAGWLAFNASSFLKARAERGAATDVDAPAESR